MHSARFRFHGNLNFFLSSKHRHRPLIHHFEWRASIKDTIESLGVPHPEIELMLVHGRPVAFDHIVTDGDEVDVYDTLKGSTMSSAPLLRPVLPGRSRFILDTHLGRLASYLRMAGFDTLYRNDYPDDLIAEIANAENRIVLTRDLGVLKRSLVTYGYFVRETNPRRRFVEVMQRFDLFDEIRPCARCTKCNGALKSTDKDAVRQDVSQRTLTHYDDFFRCMMCDKVYWQGSHYEQMQAFLNEVRP